MAEKLYVHVPATGNALGNQQTILVRLPAYTHTAILMRIELNLLIYFFFVLIKNASEELSAVVCLPFSFMALKSFKVIYSRSAHNMVDFSKNFLVNSNDKTKSTTSDVMKSTDLSSAAACRC